MQDQSGHIDGCKFIQHYRSAEGPDAGGGQAFEIDVETVGSKFLYKVRNPGHMTCTAIIQRNDLISGRRAWEKVTLGPGQVKVLGFDRSEGVARRQFVWTMTTGRVGLAPWYPVPTADHPGGPLRPEAALAIWENGDTWFLVNRDTYNRCVVSWESNLSRRDATIDPGSIELADMPVAGRPNTVCVRYVQPGSGA